MAGLFDQVGIDVACAILSEMSFKIIGHFALALHAQVVFGVAALPAALGLRRALQYTRGGTVFRRRNGCRKSGHAASGNHYVELVRKALIKSFHHIQLPLKWGIYKGASPTCSEIP